MEYNSTKLAVYVPGRGFFYAAEGAIMYGALSDAELIRQNNTSRLDNVLRMVQREGTAEIYVVETTVVAQRAGKEQLDVIMDRRKQAALAKLTEEDRKLLGLT